MHNFSGIELKKLVAFGLAGILAATSAFAGNDAKRGQAGASDLLVNPWGRSSGMAGSNTSYVGGVEAMMLNVAGMAKTRKTDIVGATSRYLVGSGVTISSLGFSQRVGEAGVMGATVMSTSLGDFYETTFEQPDGTGNLFRPSFVNIGLAYAQNFTENISGGLLLRAVNQSIPNARASGLAFDLGVQYTAGEKKQFHLGVSLRNIGPKLQYRGDGFSIKGSPNTGNISGGYTIGQLTDVFEMPALLNIGTAYDFTLDAENKLTLAGNFTSNSFTRDQILLGLEYSMRDRLMLRGGFDYRSNVFSNSDRTDAHVGPTFGATFQVPLSSMNGEGVSDSDLLGATGDKKPQKMFGVDYSYRTTVFFGGTHTIGIVLSL